MVSMAYANRINSTTKGGVRIKRPPKEKIILDSHVYLVYYGENGEVKIPFKTEWNNRNVMAVIKLIKSCLTVEIIAEKEDQKLGVHKRYRDGGQVRIGYFFAVGDLIYWKSNPDLVPVW